MDTPQSKVLEALRKRAESYGDDFNPNRSGNFSMRCFKPEAHANGDAHPSATYHPGKYIYCHVCGFTEGEVKLAERLKVKIGRGRGPVFKGGLVLEALAHAKHLPVEFLEAQGWRTQASLGNRASVFVPWYSIEVGPALTAPAYHIRNRIQRDGSGPRWIWDRPKNGKLDLYGAWRHRDYLDAAAAKGTKPYVLINESELDTVTAWLHDVPADAIGGADSWKSEWAACYQGFDTVVIIVEPRALGSMLKIARDLHESATVAEILLVETTEDCKDLNALHQQVGGNRELFQERLREWVSNARKYSDDFVLKEPNTEDRAALLQASKHLLTDGSIVHKAISAIMDLGVAGSDRDKRRIGVKYLALRSRALKRPINVITHSPPSSGKSYEDGMVLRIEDPSGFVTLTGVSERALVFSEDSFSHKILVLPEPESVMHGVGFAMLKVLAWEGRIEYRVTVKKSDGTYGEQIVTKEGPTGFFLATTKQADEQIEARALGVEVDTSEEQTRRILHAIAGSVNGTTSVVDTEPWQAASILLADPAEVVVPYSAVLASHMPTKTLRVRRDFRQLLTLISASAVTHRFQRQTDSQGRIIASLADYAIVRELASDVFQAAAAEGISAGDRDMIAAIKAAESATQADLRSSLQLGSSQVSWRVNRLSDLGYVAPLDPRARKNIRYIVIADLPDETSALPSPCLVQAWLMDNGHEHLVGSWISPVTGALMRCPSRLSETTEEAPEHRTNPNEQVTKP